eukprot:9359422-Heterocapsa_arctica.AAC.1
MEQKLAAKGEARPRPDIIHSCKGRAGRQGARESEVMHPASSVGELLVEVIGLSGEQQVDRRIAASQA